MQTILRRYIDLIKTYKYKDEVSQILDHITIVCLFIKLFSLVAKQMMSVLYFSLSALNRAHMLLNDYSKA